MHGNPVVEHRSSPFVRVWLCPKAFESLSDQLNIGRSAGQFESIQDWHLTLASDDITSQGKCCPEAAIARRDDATQLLANFRMIERTDHRPGNSAASLAIGKGGADEHER